MTGRSDKYYVWDTPAGNPVDGRYGIVMRHRGKPVALVGFNVIKFDGEGTNIRIDNYGDSITDEFPYIRQLQGGLFCTEGLEPLRWEKLLITVIEELAQECGFPSCSIQPAERGKEIRLCERSHIRYDVTAKRMGYKMWNGIWRKDFHQ